MLEFKIYLIYNMRNQVIIDKMGLGQKKSQVYRKVSFKKGKKLGTSWLVIFEVLWYFSLQAYFSKCHYLKFGVT